VPKALVCINTDFFAAEEVLEELKACHEVEEVFRVHGVYDVVAKFRGDTTESLLETITMYIKRLQGVHTAHTMLIIEPEKPAYENEDVMLI
jgi:DNA-binding Lrp family transcriptional regulator